MSKIKDAFKNGKAFIPFVTAGDPDLDTTEKLLIGMSENGADIIEIGIPFSDPIAEGVVIQEADLRSLAAGTTTDKIFDMVASLRKKTDVPIVFLGYLNTMFVYGYEKFCKRCQECGVDGLIVPDLPYEEKGELVPIAKAHGVDVITMIAPTSKQRIEMLAKEATGFIYVVSSMGVTGARSEIKTDLAEIVEVIRGVTDTPVAIGFGINTKEQVAKYSAVADGAIVGSAIVKIIAQYGENAGKKLHEYVEEMVSGLQK